MCHASEFIYNSALHLSFIYLLEYLKFVHALACSIYHTLFINDHLLTSSNPSICVQISSTMFQIPSLIHHSSHMMFGIGYHISAKIIHQRYNEWYTIYNVPQSFITHRCSHTWFSHIIMHSRWKTYIIFSALFFLSHAAQIMCFVSYIAIIHRISFMASHPSSNIIHHRSSLIMDHASEYTIHCQLFFIYIETCNNYIYIDTYVHMTHGFVLSYLKYIPFFQYPGPCIRTRMNLSCSSSICYHISFLHFIQHMSFII